MPRQFQKLAEGGIRPPVLSRKRVFCATKSWFSPMICGTSLDCNAAFIIQLQAHMPKSSGFAM